jgi:hypothetical protein
LLHWTVGVSEQVDGDGPGDYMHSGMRGGPLCRCFSPMLDSQKRSLELQVKSTSNSRSATCLFSKDRQALRCTRLRPSCNCCPSAPGTARKPHTLADGRRFSGRQKRMFNRIARITADQREGREDSLLLEGVTDQCVSTRSTDISAGTMQLEPRMNANEREWKGARPNSGSRTCPHQTVRLCSHRFLQPPPIPY